MTDHLSDGADLERETTDVNRSARRIIAVGTIIDRVLFQTVELRVRRRWGLVPG